MPNLVCINCGGETEDPVKDLYCKYCKSPVLTFEIQEAAPRYVYISFFCLIAAAAGGFLAALFLLLR